MTSPSGVFVVYEMSIGKNMIIDPRVTFCWDLSGRRKSSMSDIINGNSISSIEKKRKCSFA